MTEESISLPWWVTVPLSIVVAVLVWRGATGGLVWILTPRQDTGEDNYQVEVRSGVARWVD